MELALLIFQRAVLEKGASVNLRDDYSDSALEMNSSQSYVVVSSYPDCRWKEGRFSTWEM